MFPCQLLPTPSAPRAAQSGHHHTCTCVLAPRLAQREPTLGRKGPQKREPTRPRARQRRGWNSRAAGADGAARPAPPCMTPRQQLHSAVVSATQQQTHTCTCAMSQSRRYTALHNDASPPPPTHTHTCVHTGLRARCQALSAATCSLPSYHIKPGDAALICLSCGTP